MGKMKAVGIDLAGKEENPTGFAVLEGKEIATSVLNSDEEVVEACRVSGPDVVAIDAPLSFPEGWLRRADSELIGRGYRVLPPKLGGMKYLTERGISLSERLEGEAMEVIEVHPLTSGRILFGSKERDDWIGRLSGEGYALGEGPDEHEVDAMVAALTGLLHLRGETEEVGEGDETVVIPLDRAGVP